MDAEANLAVYLGKRDPTHRYASFDYCFNHFQSYREAGRLDELTDGEHLQLSCLHLAFYLASCGMLRGSSPLLQRSLKVYAPVVQAIVGADRAIWDIDVHNYDEAAIARVLSVREYLRSAFLDSSSDILLTKVMLGVFGCVPAFDSYFKKGFGVWSLSAASLRRVSDFYWSNKDLVEKHRIPTIDFETSVPTTHRYTRAKVIDMIFFCGRR